MTTFIDISLTKEDTITMESEEQVQHCEHNHDEVCCHDHHEHHHEHDENRCHEHHHGEECCHEHDIDNSDVVIVNHEGALAGSFETSTRLSKSEVDIVIRDYMNILRDMVKINKGVIGHIKAAVTDGENTSMYSLTWNDVGRTESFNLLKDRITNVSFAAIIYGLSENVLLEVLRSMKEFLSAGSFHKQ